MDPVLEIAARESGVPIGDILENLPAELSVWVDPGEVSYRIGEKGAVKVSFFNAIFILDGAISSFSDITLLGRGHCFAE